jgi:hypothetical protein
MHQLELAQERTDESIIGIDPQLIEPMFGVRPHILVKERQRAKCQRQKHCPFDEFENGDEEQSSVAARVRSFFGRHYSPYRRFTLSRTENNCVSARRLSGITAAKPKYQMLCSACPPWRANAFGV